jgi:hypothetical protein
VSNHGPYSDLSGCILQHTYMSVEDHALTDGSQRSFLTGNARVTSGFIAWRRGRMNQNNSNRGGDGEKRTGQGTHSVPNCAFR